MENIALPDRLYRVTGVIPKFDVDGFLEPHTLIGYPLVPKGTDPRSVPLAYEQDWDLAARFVRSPGVPFLASQSNLFTLLVVDPDLIDVVDYHNNRWFTQTEIFGVVPKEAILEQRLYEWQKRDSPKIFSKDFHPIIRFYYWFTRNYDAVSSDF